MESISILTRNNPQYATFLKAARAQQQWKHVFFLETIDGWLKAFDAHATPYLLADDNYFLPLLQKKGKYFVSLGDFLFGDGPCSINKPPVLSPSKLESFSFCLPEQFQSAHKKIEEQEYFFVKEASMSFFNYISTLGAGWRKELRRRKNKWVGMSCMHVQPQRFLKDLPRFFIAHRRRFGSSFYNSKELLVYVYYLIKTRPQDILAFELTDNSQSGCIVWVRMGNRMNLFSIVSDAPEKLNAGKALIYFSLEKLFEIPGTFEINFDTGYGHYKEHWAKQTRTYVLYLPVGA